MLGNQYTSEATRLASSETAPVPHMVLWRAGSFPHPATQLIAFSAQLTPVDSSDKELVQELSTQALAQSGDPSAFSVAASLVTREASRRHIFSEWVPLRPVLQPAYPA